MRFIVFFSIFFSLLLSARENPFTPAQATTKSSSIKSLTVAPKKRGPKIHPQRPIVIKKVDVPSPDSENNVVFNTLKSRFLVYEDRIYIETKDRLKKHFSLEHPNRIVIDFRSSSDFASKRSIINGLPVTKIEVGAHGSYYRVVFRLDKSYRYSVEDAKYGLLLKLNP